jgi:hypothetical protein
MLDTVQILRRAAEHARTPLAEGRLRALADTIERAPKDRRPAIVAAAVLTIPALAPLKTGTEHGLVRLAAPQFSPMHVGFIARILLGETPAQVTGLSKRDAHAFMTQHRFLVPIYWYQCNYAPDTPSARTMQIARWLADVRRDPSRWDALTRQRKVTGPHGETIGGSYLDRLDEIRDSDLRPSVDDTFTRAARRVWKANERLLAKRGEPLIAAPTWYRPIRCVRILLSPAELIVEGREMHHCVAGYAPYVQKGESVILALNVCGHRSTVELSRDGRTVRQHKGFDNSVPHALCVRALAVLMKKWKRTTSL